MIPVFDLDGTLLDSDDALLSPFEALGIGRELVRFGHPLEFECARLGVSVTDYLAVYDPAAALPFAGVNEMLSRLDRWAICSNKHPRSGIPELTRLDWLPEVAVFADEFAGAPKNLNRILEVLKVDGADVIYIGDTVHDRLCAVNAGCRFAFAGWNPRARPEDGDLVLDHPNDLIELGLVTLSSSRL